LIKRIELETFCYESEDREKVEQALRNVATGTITSERMTAHLGTKIVKLRMEVKDLGSFMEKIRPLKIDPVPHIEGNTVYFRLSKQQAYLGEIKLDTKDVILVRVQIQAYPAKKAVEEAVRLFRFQKNKL
jgi:RNA binding exosome subunit